jgi:hypothetical protein
MYKGFFIYAGTRMSRIITQLRATGVRITDEEVALISPSPMPM